MEYTIKTGNKQTLNFGWLKSLIVVYCGMPNENTFVLAPFKGSGGYLGFSPNVFYKTNATQIQLLNKNIKVRQVTPEYIVIEI